MKRTLLFFFLPFIISTYLSYILFIKACDYAMNVQAEKPLPFNHKTHMTKYNISNCEFCHGYYENGRFKGIPTVAVCKQCHEGKTAAEKIFFKNYKDTDTPWTSFAQQPDLVYFSHIAVMKNKKTAQCASCHGNKGVSMTTAKIKGKMLMGQCMDCHDSLKISNKCMVCHD